MTSVVLYGMKLSTVRSNRVFGFLFLLINHFPLEWKQPGTLYYLVILCSVAAAVQGMDETVVNGAQLFYPEQFGIGSDSEHDSILVGRA
jgi:hypothetical protein